MKRFSKEEFMALKFNATGKTWLLIVLLLVISWIAALTISNRIKANRGQRSQVTSLDPGSLRTQSSQRRVTYEGIGFSYPSILGENVKAETVTQHHLERADEKPDSATPRHVSFHLEGSYAEGHRSSFFDSPAIHVYPLSDYKRVLAASKQYVEELDRDVQSLKRILTDRPSHIEGTIPVLPWIDAVQTIRAHVRYVQFRNGRGITFLTQYNIEPAIVNNDGLAYLFQGLTDDGRYYISATFPVSAPDLPKNFDTETFAGYTVPENFYENYDSNKKAYEQYLDKIERKLNDLPSDQYTPNLQLFEELMSSLTID